MAAAGHSARRLLVAVAGATLLAGCGASEREPHARSQPARTEARTDVPPGASPAPSDAAEAELGQARAATR